MKNLLLGIDIGTSSCKTALFRQDGTVVAQESREYSVCYPSRGFVEQDPEEWWKAVRSALMAMKDTAGTLFEEIAGIGIDGQGWSAVAVDAEGNVLCNSPIWMDTRAAGMCKEWNERIGEDRILEICGNPLKPSYTLPKILWFKKYKPEIYNRTHKILQSNSFIGYKLTGSMTQDISQGYAWQCFDIRNGCWSEEACRLFDLDIRMLPDIFSCHQVIGKVTKSAATLTGLCEGTPVVAGGLDAACGALGAGVIHPGETQEQGGQAGGMSICLDAFKADPRLILSCHVVPGMWLLQGGTVGGGGVIRWFEREFCAEERMQASRCGKSSMAEMDLEAESVPAGSDGLIFLPYMAGERSPVWDAHAKGVYYGIDYTKTRAHFIRASMEGVAFSLKHNLDAAKETGADAEVLRSMGGAANSRFWTQMKADVTGKRIVVPASDTATALGAAILAGVGTGVYTDFEDAVSRTIRIRREHIPDMTKHFRYEEAYGTYLALYRNLTEIMHRKDPLGRDPDIDCQKEA
jgi:xylulokinase